MNKYYNTKINYNGERFDSKKEMKRFITLQLLERAGEIHDLRRQVTYKLIPAQYEVVNGKKCCIERECVYKADFVYKLRNGAIIVEDTKGIRTKDYIIKRKLMLWVHKIRINEV